MRKLFVMMLCGLCAALMPAPLWAQKVAPPVMKAIHSHVPNAAEVGTGRMRVALWNVYDATLIAPDARWQADKPFALSIRYMREIDGADIADRSAEEIRDLGFDDEMKLAAWHAQMRDIFPDVKDGTIITGVYKPGKGTFFYHNEARAGSIADDDFGRWFFDIWLSQKTPEPSLRAALLGLR